VRWCEERHGADAGVRDRQSVDGRIDVERRAADGRFRRPTLFPSDNWWNQDISSAPVDPQSDAYITFIGRTRTSHPDFGPPPYGIPYVGVGGSEARTPVTFVDYGSESDNGFKGEVGYPIPAAAQIATELHRRRRSGWRHRAAIATC
jgi:hypothetical protein